MLCTILFTLLGGTLYNRIKRRNLLVCYVSEVEIRLNSSPSIVWASTHTRHLPKGELAEHIKDSITHLYVNRGTERPYTLSVLTRVFFIVISNSTCSEIYLDKLYIVIMEFN